MVDDHRRHPGVRRNRRRVLVDGADRVDVRLVAVAQHVLEQHPQRVRKASDVVGGLQRVEPEDLVGTVSDFQLRRRSHCHD